MAQWGIQRGPLFSCLTFCLMCLLRASVGKVPGLSAGPVASYRSELQGRHPAPWHARWRCPSWETQCGPATPLPALAAAPDAHSSVLTSPAGTESSSRPELVTTVTDSSCRLAGIILAPVLVPSDLRRESDLSERRFSAEHARRSAPVCVEAGVRAE